MRIGVYGGTFDPPHIGHLILAVEAVNQLALDKLLWVLTPQPPHKEGKNIHTLRQRLELINAVVALESQFELSTVDLDRPGPHYSVDTMAIINECYLTDELYFLIGGDSLVNMPRWYQPQHLVEITPAFGVMRRPGYEIDLPAIEKQLPGISKKIAWVDTPLLEISSTDIRQRIQTGRPYEYFLPAPVYRIIRKKRYYLSSTG